MDELERKALEYHMRGGVSGKVSVVPTKPCRTAEDLALAYTPGVAKPVLSSIYLVVSYSLLFNDYIIVIVSGLVSE